MVRKWNVVQDVHEELHSMYIDLVACRAGMFAEKYSKFKISNQLLLKYSLVLSNMQAFRCDNSIKLDS